MILRGGRGELHIVVELEHLIGEGRIVGENADGIVVNVKAVFHGLQGDGFGSVGDQPVELGQGQLLTERNVREVH